MNIMFHNNHPFESAAAFFANKHGTSKCSAAMIAGAISEASMVKILVIPLSLIPQ